MRLFTKLGGKETNVVYGKTNIGQSACISFSRLEHVAKFLAQASHTIGENGMTQLAHVGPCNNGKFASSNAENHGKLLNAQNDASNSKSCHETHYAQNVGTDHQDIQSFSRADCGPSIVLEASIPVPDARTVLQNPPLQNAVNQVCPLEQGVYNLSVPSASHSLSWRCIHNNIVIPPTAPEILASGDNYCSVCVQWPTVIHATAYVVELFDQGTMASQRFVRGTPAGILPQLVDLRVDGLQTSTCAASVRCVAPCGCESVSSPWSFFALASAPPPAAVAPVFPMPPPHVSAATLCPPPPSAPATLPVSATMPAVPPALPPILEETHDTMGTCSQEILTLD